MRPFQSMNHNELLILEPTEHQHFQENPSQTHQSATRESLKTKKHPGSQLTYKEF